PGSHSLRTFFSSGWLHLLAVAAAHLGLFVVIYWIAFQLRFDFVLSMREREIFYLTLPWVVATKFGTFFFTRHYHNWSHHVTFADLASLGWAALCSLACLAVMNQVFFISWHFIPRVVLLLDFAGTILCLGALRSSWRFLQEHAWPFIY